MAMDKAGNVVLDIDRMKQNLDKCCSGNKYLARKGSYRVEKRGVEEQEAEEHSKNLLIKVLPPQMDQMKQQSVSIKALISVPSVLNSSILADSGDGRSKRFQGWTAIHPRKIVLFFATMWSVGTMTLIYFTLSINRRG
ncbi:hypothetical protein KSP39_PZI006568 [Platanthera zijinensis]|uniref:Uncharacterized protein n=1 Tax=Platanthera zijinensis TaxID=2320716 RepID=A0AAP0BT46_9ASPA